MKKVYPVLFTQTKECVLIEVPDLEILTEGKNMNDAIDMVRDAIELKYVTMEDEKLEIAEPSDILDIGISSGTFASEGKTIISMVDVNPSEYRRRIDSKVRVAETKLSVRKCWGEEEVADALQV